MNRYEKIEQIKEDYLNELPEPVSAWPPKVQRATSCIHSYLYDHRLTVQWMMEQCRLNGHNFAGKFKHYVGETPKRYWLHHRLQTAKLMLRDEVLADASVVDIALSVGFNSHSSFTTTFKKYVGCTPGEYRDGKN